MDGALTLNALEPYDGATGMRVRRARRHEPLATPGGGDRHAGSRADRRNQRRTFLERMLQRPLLTSGHDDATSRHGGSAVGDRNGNAA